MLISTEILFSLSIGYRLAVANLKIVELELPEHLGLKTERIIALRLRWGEAFD